MTNVISQLEEFTPSMLFNEQNLPTPGGALLVLHPDQDVVLARSTVAAFMMRDRESGRSIYKGLTFVAPPEALWPRDEDQTLDLLLAGLAEVRGELTPTERGQLRSKFQFARVSILHTEQVVEALEAAGASRFVFLPHVTAYREASHASGEGSPSLRLEEDLWVPDTVKLARRLIAVAQVSQSFVLMTTAVSAPTLTSNNEQLLRVEELAVAGLKDSGQVELLTKLSRWAALAKAGRAEEAMAQLEASALPDLTKKQARMQILNHSGDREGAAKLIRELRADMSPAEGMAVQWAGICFKADDHDTARELLDGCLDEVMQEHHLEAVLQMATQLREPGLVQRAWTRLHGLFPGSMTLSYDCELRLLQICRSPKEPAVAAAVARTGFGDHHTFLAEKLSEPRELEYSELLTEVDQRWSEHRELALMCCATHAAAVGAPVAAWRLAEELVPETRFSPAAARLIHNVMRELLLADGVEAESTDLYKLPVALVLSHLAAHPGDGPMRALLLETLSVERSGSIGYPLLIAVTLDCAGSAPEPVPEKTAVPEVASEEELGAFLGRLQGWIEENRLLDPRGSLPATVVGTNASGLSRLMLKSLEGELAEDSGVKALNDLDFQAHLLPLVVKHVPDGADDIHALRELAGRHSLAGQQQKARDLAELILEIAGDSPVRKRLAWGAYADIYMRAHRLPDVLVGLTCAAMTQATLATSDLAYEVYTLYRAVRDVGLSDFASQALAAYKDLQARLGASEAVQNRVTVKELAFRLQQTSRKDVTALQALLAEAETAVEQALALEDELYPPAFLLAQLSALVVLAGGQLPEPTRALNENVLARFDPDTAVSLRALSSPRPSTTDLVALHNKASGARYSADAPTDARALGIATRRLLLPSDPELADADVFLGCELLAERGLTRAAPAAPLTPQWPAQYANLLAQEDVSVLVLALDDNGEFVGAIADGTGTRVVRPALQEASARNRLRTWATTYPYKYGKINPHHKELDPRTQRMREVGDREFYDSVRSLDVPLPPGNRVVVVAEPEVAQLTFNVLFKDRELAGYSTAFGMAPSLSWLADVRRRQVGGDGRKVAWISAGGASEEELDPLRAVLQGTERAMQAHDVQLHTTPELPDGFQGAQMAIVTAHGQLTTDGRFIHRIVDEGVLKESPSDLSLALADVELVILFVCSGGRVDRHPYMSTTVGLPKMLLNKGCRTVIASPWPLESVVPGNWLPAFLDAWASGATAMDACHRANTHVASLDYPAQPQRSLAMAVYGDPLLKGISGSP